MLIAYGKVVAFIATLAMLVSARGLAEIIANRQTQIVEVDGFLDFFRVAPSACRCSSGSSSSCRVAGWFLLNRTTFGRRTIAVGGNPEAPAGGHQGQAPHDVPVRPLRPAAASAA